MHVSPSKYNKTSVLSVSDSSNFPFESSLDDFSDAEVLVKYSPKEEKKAEGDVTEVQKTKKVESSVVKKPVTKNNFLSDNSSDDEIKLV